MDKKDEIKVTAGYAQVQEDKFTKEAIVNSLKYKANKDLLKTILQDNKEYTFKEVDEKIEKFMKGKVN